MHFDHSSWIIYVIYDVHMCVDDTIIFGAQDPSTDRGVGYGRLGDDGVDGI